MAAINYTPIDELIKRYTEKKQIGLPREVEPFRISESTPLVETNEVQEVVEHTVGDDEVTDTIEVRKENIDVSEELEQTGVKAVTSTKFPSYQNVKLPISDDRVIVGLKSPLNTSLRWLATYALYLLWQAHLQLKVVHGKVVRVMQKRS